MTAYRILIIGAAVTAFGVPACTTKDPREGFSAEDAARPRGLGERCNAMAACATGLTCLEGTCTPDAFAAACTPSPCGEGLCNARGTEQVLAFCRCGGIPVSAPSKAADVENFLWDGSTCVEDVFPKWPGSVTHDTTCPAVELAPGVPDESTADCPVNDFTFCTEQKRGGDCLELLVELEGRIKGTRLGGSITGGAVLKEARCIREYIEGKKDGSSDGMQLVITGTSAASLFPGTSTITIDISAFDAARGGAAMIVWPRDHAPYPRCDAGFVDVTITSTGSAFSQNALGGEFIIASVSGPDANDDKRVDSGKGAIGGEFYLDLDNDDYLSGAFTVRCGKNVLVAQPPDCSKAAR